MASVINFLSAHYKDIILAILAIDAALLPIFPSAGILVSIKNVLSGLVSKP